MHSGEKVGITYHHGKHRRTIWDTVYYNGVQEDLKIDEGNNYYEYELQYQLPVQQSQTIRFNKLFVFHEAIAHVDVKMGSDPVFKFDIPVIPRLPQGSPLLNGGTFENQGVQVTIDRLFGHTGDSIPITVIIPDDVKYRSVRLELVQRINKFLRRYSDYHSNSFTLFESPAGQQTPNVITLPQIAFSSVHGTFFNITHTMKLVIDIAWGSDINVEFEFGYFTVPRSVFEEVSRREELVQVEHRQGIDAVKMEEPAKPLDEPLIDDTGKECVVCGSELPENSQFCSECGSKV